MPKRAAGLAQAKMKTAWSGLAMMICWYSPRGVGAVRESARWRSHDLLDHTAPRRKTETSTWSPRAATSPLRCPFFSRPRRLHTQGAILGLDCVKSGLQANDQARDGSQCVCSASIGCAQSGLWRWRLFAFRRGSAGDVESRLPGIEFSRATIEIQLNDAPEDRSGVVRAFADVLHHHRDGDIGFVLPIFKGITGEPGVRLTRSGLGGARLAVHRHVQPGKAVPGSAAPVLYHQSAWHPG